MFVWTNLSGVDGLSKGDEIQSINGKKPEAIIKQMYTCLAGDGSIETYRQKQLSIGFPWMYYLYVEQPEAFDLVISREADQQEQRITIPAITRAKMVEQAEKLRAREPKQTAEATGIDRIYTFEIADSVAYLTLKSFTGPGSKSIKSKQLNFTSPFLKKSLKSR